MGPGDRFQYGITNGIGLYIKYDRFPYAHTFTICIPFFFISYGFGKSYID